jgi:hypothetical protein
MPVKINDLPNKNVVDKYVMYCPETGVFTSNISHKYCKVGQVVGLKDRNYIRIYIEKKYYAAHRLAWFLINGEIDSNHQIDHIDGDRSNNRISNLRLATHADNCRNIGLPKHNRSGVKGVHFHKQNGKWRAQIKLNGKRHWLGNFERIEDAKFAYDNASKTFHGEFRRE